VLRQQRPAHGASRKKFKRKVRHFNPSGRMRQ
jgi:hypothetical protein